MKYLSFNVCSSCSEVMTDDMVAVARPLLNSRAHKQYHWSWHDIRGAAWRDAQLNPELNRVHSENQINGYLTSGWIDRTIYPNFRTWAQKHHINNSEISGEDFLFMHRKMLKMLNVELGGNGQPCMRPPSQLPASINDSRWPIPAMQLPGMTAARRREIQAKLDEVRSMENELTPQYMRGVSLGEMASKIEGGLHIALHQLFSTQQFGGPRTCSGPVGDAAPTDFSDACNELIPTQSAVSNRHFYELHSYIDGFVGKWLDANRTRYDRISENCGNDLRCYQWKGTWVGRMPDI